MTFFWPQTKTYNFTAFSANQLLSQGTLGSSVSIGDCFKMPTAADTSFCVKDDDSRLSGDACRDENADDWSGQTASITTLGQPAGNGGQIYAESYFWVQDQYGRTYMLIEIEQECGGSYYTFSGSCGLPPAGSLLKIVGQCNVSGDWIDYCSLGAGQEQKLGTVSGTVFSDTNCDGINGIQKVIPGCDYVIEAEAMCKSNFVTVCSGGASGGKFVRLACNGGTAELAANFGGKSGVYDITIRVQDENDGRSTIKLLIDGQYVTAIRLDRDTDGAGSDCGGFSTFVIRDVKVDCGDQIKLAVWSDGGEFVRIDNIKLEGQDTTLRTPEPTMAGVTVQLVKLDGTVVATTATDANGDYKFANVVPGQYKVVGVNPDGTKFTIKDAGGDDTIDSDLNSKGVSDIVTVAGGATADVDFGLCTIKYGSIAGRYFLDGNRDGVDNAEPGLGGKTVSLLDANGALIRTTTTAADGSYLFAQVEPGTYKVAFAEPTDGLVFTGQNVGADDAVDSDVDPQTGVTATITLAPGEAKTDIDAGVKDPATAEVGNLVFLDANGNGLRDEGEAGVDGVAVELRDDKGAVVGTTVTANGGLYSFTGLTAGSYALAFAATEGLAFTTKSAAAADALNDDSDADALGLTDTFILSAGEIETDIDAGLVVLNKAPTPQNDTGRGCADTEIVVNVLGNDSDPEGDALTVTKVNGIAIGAETIDIDGVKVTLRDGKLVFDGETAQAALDIGQKATVSYSYTVADPSGNEAIANVDITFCGDANSVESFCATLPSGAVTYQVAASNVQAPVGPEAFTVQIISSGQARFDGDIFANAYCISIYETIETTETLPGTDVIGRMVCSLDPAAATLFNANQVSIANGKTAAENLDIVNWILNQDFEAAGTYTGWEIQRAIWEFTDKVNTDYLSTRDPGYGSNAAVDELVALASQHDGYVPGLDGKVGVILEPTDGISKQPLIVAINVEDYDCFCFV